MKEAIRIFAIILMVLCFSCEGSKWLVNCEDCYSEEPVETVVRIKLRDIQAPVTIKIYDGDLEDNIILTSFEAYGSEYTVNTGINKKLTFTATYNISGRVYIAVDSTVPRVKYEKDLCDNPCYYVYDNIVDLRLRRTVPGS
ncbi:MAG TPA: hypothetical protein PLS58_07575 [Bacteroidales bacterium]|jgi:hypothetical protein|nr:hypothetical protein [Bacteroidales bacterium]